MSESYASYESLLLKLECQGTLRTEAPLRDYSSWRVGGAAEYLYIPKNVVDLAALTRVIPLETPILYLGLGSNILIREGGIPGWVIVTQGGLQEIEWQEEGIVRVEAGVACATLARMSARRGLEGAEFLAGIPGTLGGALRMNAGCFDGQTWDHVLQVEIMDRNGAIHIKTPKDFQIAYREVLGLRSDEWFVAATFQFEMGKKEEAFARIHTLLEHRARTQPTGAYNCGSVFRNPPNHFAGQLIEMCELKGCQIGGAFVSPQHANFIINDGTAVSADLEQLIHHIVDCVFQKTGILLQKEVHILGENEPPPFE